MVPSLLFAAPLAGHVVSNSLTPGACGMLAFAAIPVVREMTGDRSWRSQGKTKSGTLPSAGAFRSRTRWFVLFLISLMYLITYMDRANISVTAPAMASEFGLSKIEMGLVFSAFAWAYAAGQIPGGWLADRFGPKKVLLSIVSFWSFMTAATAWPVGALSLFIVRFLFGLGEAGAFPTATRAMQLWFPARSAASSRASPIASAGWRSR